MSMRSLICFALINAPAVRASGYHMCRYAGPGYKTGSCCDVAAATDAGTTACCVGKGWSGNDGKMCFDLAKKTFTYASTSDPKITYEMLMISDDYAQNTWHAHFKTTDDEPHGSPRWNEDVAITPSKKDSDPAPVVHAPGYHMCRYLGPDYKTGSCCDAVTTTDAGTTACCVGKGVSGNDGKMCFDLAKKTFTYTSTSNPKTTYEMLMISDDYAQHTWHAHFKTTDDEPHGSPRWDEDVAITPSKKDSVPAPVVPASGYHMCRYLGPDHATGSCCVAAATTDAGTTSCCEGKGDSGSDGKMCFDLAKKTFTYTSTLDPKITYEMLMISDDYAQHTWHAHFKTTDDQPHGSPRWNEDVAITPASENSDLVHI